VARAFSTLEGIGLSIDEDYAIVQECYPYLARRLFTDRSPRAKTALRAMLGLDGVVDGRVAPGNGGRPPSHAASRPARAPPRPARAPPRPAAHRTCTCKSLQPVRPPHPRPLAARAPAPPPPLSLPTHALGPAPPQAW
jgi:hypothetical protein